MKHTLFIIVLLTSACGHDEIKISDETFRSNALEIISVYRQVGAKYDEVHNNLITNIDLVTLNFPCRVDEIAGVAECDGLTEFKPDTIEITVAKLDLYNSYNSNFWPIHSPEELWKTSLIHELTHAFFIDSNHERDDLWCDPRGHNRGPETCSSDSLTTKVLNEMKLLKNN